jgi:hypothetical protein
MIRTSQPWRDNHEGYLNVDIRLEIHVEQVQAFIRDRIKKNKEVGIIAIVPSSHGCDVLNFPLYTTEDVFCRELWKYGIKHDIDEMFVSYPSRAFMIDNPELKAMDYWTKKEMNPDMKTDCVVLAYYTWKDSTYKTRHLWAAIADSDINDWIRYDPRTLRKLNE